MKLLGQTIKDATGQRYIVSAYQPPANTYTLVPYGDYAGIKRVVPAEKIKREYDRA